MKSAIIGIDARQITDWASFHEVFARAFGFPQFYGRNMDAWIDCMTSLDSPDDGMTSVHTVDHGVVVLRIDYVDDLARRCPEQYEAIIECSAFVNWRRIEVGEEPVLALSFNRTPPRK